MTFQTTPNLPWIFPDQAYHMNHRGTIPEIAMRPLDALVGSPSSWSEEARKVAMDRVRNTQKAKLGMEGKLNTTERSQRYERPASRSAVPNGVFHGSPMEYVTSGGLRGGVITTKEGQEWLAKRLKQRIEEYNNLSSGTPVKQEPIPVSPYTEVDTILNQLFTYFSAGSFTSNVSVEVNKLLQGLLKIGSLVTPSQLAKYSTIVGKLIESIRPYFNDESGRLELFGADFTPNDERKRLIDQIYKSLELCDQVIREIARTIYESQPSREQVMASLNTRLLSSQVATYDPTKYGVVRREGVQNVEPLPMGRTFEGEPPREVQREFPRPTGRELPAPRTLVREEPAGDFVPFVDEAAPAPAQEAGPLADLEEITGRMEGLGKRRGRPRKH